MQERLNRNLCCRERMIGFVEGSAGLVTRGTVLLGSLNRCGVRSPAADGFQRAATAQRRASRLVVTQAEDADSGVSGTTTDSVAKKTVEGEDSAGTTTERSSKSSSAQEGTVQAAASTECAPPPSTFYQAVRQAFEATEAALDKGHKLMEIEFPPLPQDQMDSSAVGAYAVIDANLRLVLDYAKLFAEKGKRVVLTLPDAAEKDRALEMSDENEEPYPGVRLGSLKDTPRGNFFEQLLTDVEIDVAVREDDDLFIILSASCQELPDVESLVEEADGRPVVFFNLKLDTSRGDLGLPAFPPKDLHFRFLSRVIPVYYLRTRSYSRSVPQPPYVINYSGALYRVFPGPYQILLNAGGSFQRVHTEENRPALGAVRDELTKAMNISAEQAPAPLLTFLRRGVKSTTWWEEDFEMQESNNWRM